MRKVTIFRQRNVERASRSDAYGVQIGARILCDVMNDEIESHVEASRCEVLVRLRIQQERHAVESTRLYDVNRSVLRRQACVLLKRETDAFVRHQRVYEIVTVDNFAGDATLDEDVIQIW